MKRKIKPTSIFLLFLIFNLISAGQDYKFITFNIRYDNPNDGINVWSGRKVEAVKLLENYDPDIFGLQEALYHQVEYINSGLKNYKYLGVGRDDGKLKGEFTPVFFDTTKFRVVKASTFWLSTTPDTVSIGWDAALPRICTYVLFKDKTSNQQFWILNTHFDHIGVEARRKSALLILTKIQELNVSGFPVIVMGDLNSEPQSQPIQIFESGLSNSMKVSKIPGVGPIGTFNAFDINFKMNHPIDYIFVLKFYVESYQHLEVKRSDGGFISDHSPVFVKLRISNL